MKVFSTRFYTPEHNKLENKKTYASFVSFSSAKNQRDVFVPTKPDYHALLKNADGNLSEKDINLLVNACKDDDGNVVEKIFNNALKLAKYNHPKQDCPPSRIIAECNNGFSGEDNFSQEAFDGAVKLLDNGFSYGGTASTIDICFDRDNKFNPKVIELALKHKDTPHHLKILQTSTDGRSGFNEYFFNKFVDYSKNHVYSEPELSDFKWACVDNSLKLNKTAIDTGLKLASDYYDKCVGLGDVKRLLEKCNDKKGLFNEEALQSLTKDIPERLENYYLYLSSRLESSINAKGDFEKTAFDLYNSLYNTLGPGYSTDTLNTFINMARNNEGVIDKNTAQYIIMSVDLSGPNFAVELVPKLKNKKGDFDPQAVKTWLKLEKDFETPKTQWLEVLKGGNGKYPDGIYEAFKYFKKSYNRPAELLTKNCKNKKGDFAPKIFEFEKKLLKTLSENNVANLIPAIKNADGNDIDYNKYNAYQKLAESMIFMSDITKILPLSSDVNILNYNTQKAIEINESQDEALIYPLTVGDVIAAFADENGKFQEEKYQEFKKLLDAALENKNVLRTSENGITDEDIYNLFNVRLEDTVSALTLAGEKTLEYAFSLKLDGLGDFIEKAAFVCEALENDRKKSGAQKNETVDFKEILLKNINPKNTKEYKSLQSEQKALKEKLYRLLTKEEKMVLKTNKEEIQKLENEKSELKKRLSTDFITKEEKEEILSKIKNCNQKIKQHKQTFQNAANKQPQLQEKISELEVKMRAMKDSAIKDPKAIIDLINIIDAFTDKKNQKYLEQIISYINAKTPEEKEIYQETLNKMLFQKVGVRFDEQTARQLDMAKSQYLAGVFASDTAFNNNFSNLINLIKENKQSSVKEILCSLPQNIDTKKQFEALGINYDRWVSTDKNSYVRVNIQTDEQKAKQAAIKNLEADFNDTTFKKLPKDERNRLIGVLKTNGVDLILKDEEQYDEDGYLDGKIKILRMYKNGRPIEFEMLEKLVSELKKDINSNSFWDELDAESDEDNPKSTIYNHLVKLRYADVKNALKTRNNKHVEMEVRKSDMNDISHSLFLGNHSSCCTAVGSNSNDWSAPNYIKNKLISSIEVVDGSKSVGNTMCFFAEVDGETSLVLDNIELNSQYQFNDKIRDAIVEYAKKLTEEVGQPDMPIYAGPNRHKVNMDIFPLKKRNITILGSSGNDKLYIDYDTKAHKIDGEKKDIVELFKIR